MRLQNLGLLDKFTGFLEGESVNEFFSTFDIKFSSGTWAAGGFSDRFMSRGYSPDLPSDVKSRIERIWRAGIRGCFDLHNHLQHSYSLMPSTSQ